MWMRKLSIEHLGLGGKRVVMRVDFNVLVENGRVKNNTKILSGLDSIVYALVKEANSVVVISHLGWPRGTRNMKFSLTPVAEELENLLKRVHEDPHSMGKYSQFFKLFASSKNAPKVTFLSDCCGPEIEEFCQNPPPGSIYLLENIQFHMEEEGYGEDTSGNRLHASAEAIKLFRQSLRRLGDVFINDTFSLAHKMHSSILGDGFEKRASGLLLNKEIRHFAKAIYKPDRPYLAILGGIKIIDKYHMIDSLLDKVSEMIIAGAMAFPFLKKLKRMQTGHSLFDVEGYKIVKMIMKKAKNKRVHMHFPVDFMTSSKLGAIQIETVRTGIEDGWMGLDVGPETCGVFQRIIMRARTIVWNGPIGAYELDHFGTGTESVLLDVAKATKRGCTSILVGEDTAACAEKWHQQEFISHISSGGQPAKDILQGKLLPGIVALSDPTLL